jgi:outer membrane protein OmpA-like peptidoglycan-associated protein
VNAGSPVNSEKWDAFPGFMPQNQTLYFSSDRNGGQGKKDIWRSQLLGFDENGNPRWRVPVNMGNKVNTSGNETAPVVNTVNKNLYFASDALPGMGGLDIFEAELNESGNAVKVSNLGYPINTYQDDDDLNFSHISDSTYFTSSRQTNKGQQIYAFNFDRGVSVLPLAYVQVMVKDARTKQPLATEIRLEYQPFHPMRFQIQETNEKGESVFGLNLNRNYAFTISEPGYLFASRFLNIGKANSVEKPEELVIELEPIEIGAEVQLYNINFETDSFNILPNSYPELQKVSVFLANNKNLKVEIQGHTDSSGNADYNQRLSERRAKSVVDYLAGQGIEKARLKYMGYGDKAPVASNETEEGRMLNRRTTIKIIEK